MSVTHPIPPQPDPIARGARTEATIAPLTFIASQQTRPRILSQALTGGEPVHLFETEEHAVPIADMRLGAGAHSLDREGFALRRAPTAVVDLYDDDAVVAAYAQEVRTLLRAELGADQVAVFDATRRSDAGGGAVNRDGVRRPAGRIHVDYTARSGPKRARDVLGAARVDHLLAAGARIVQVNVWRPIVGPVRRAPLALADAASVRPADLIATEQVFPDRVGEIYHLQHNPAQRWLYAPEMARDEALLIKGWDSADDGRARFTPHSAFTLPDQDPDAPARESIELRTFAVIR